MPKSKMLLFVCTGNTCRSPLAKVLARAALQEAGVDDWLVESAGLAANDGLQASEDAQTVAREYGLDLSGHRARALTPELLAQAGLVLVMTGGHKTALTAAAPEAAEKIYTVREFVAQAGDIADPYGRGLSCYSRTARELAELMQQVAARIKE